MSNFIVIGSSNTASANRSAVFREILEGRVPGARYVGQESLFRGNSMLYRAITSRRLLRFTQRHPRLKARYDRFLDATYRGGRGLDLRGIRAMLADGEDNYLIFCHGTRVDRINEAMLRTLRRELPGCRLVYYLVDSIERTGFINHMDLSATLDYLRLFDFAFTYDRADASVYGDVVRFIEIPLWRSPAPAPEAPEWDLYFCGKDKRRRDLLLDIHGRLQEAGMRCRFRIIWRTGDTPQLPGIEWSEWTPYESMVDELLRANCVLEILALHNNESTLRYKEAVIYNKKLLTTNPNIADLPYYDPRWMRVFQTAEDIDLDWLRRVEPVDYGYRGDYSAETFLRRVKELTAQT